MSEREARLVREALQPVWEALTMVEAYTADGAWEKAYDSLLNAAYPALRAADPVLCNALEEANERIRELEEQVRTYMEFPYTVPKQR